MRRSRWREFIEVRDSFLAVISLPSLPSELLRDGPRLGALLAEERRTRLRQLPTLQAVLKRLS